LQSLVQSARQGEPGVFVSLAEPPRQVVENAAGFGWDLEELEQGKLAFIDGSGRPGFAQLDGLDFAGMLAGARAVAAELGATRIVFDSLDVPLALIDARQDQARELFRLRDWLLENGLTALITTGTGEGNRPAWCDLLERLVADCMITLDYRLDEGVATRRLRVVKYRGSRFVEHELPYIIGPTGIEVPLRPEPKTAALTPEIAQARKQLTARIQALDHLIEMKQAELDFLAQKEGKRARVRRV
jgi:circadian clock protein KaiC